MLGVDLHPEKFLTLDIDASGTIQDKNAALFSVKAKVNSAENAEFSSLLRKPIPLSQGGLLHFQSDVFPSRQDPDFQALRDWTLGVVDGTENESVPPLDARETVFLETVYPTLVKKGCAIATCHGPLNFGGAPFATPAVVGTTLVPRTALRATYNEARHNLALAGDPLQSRLLRKMLPLEKGGIPHKGGNDLFFSAALEKKADPRDTDEVKAMLAWINLEREHALGEVDGIGGALPSVTQSEWPIVFVSGPIAPARPFEIAPFTPGTDILRLDPPWASQAAVNLTASHHKDPADIRDPAVSHNGRLIAFAMRRTAEDASNIYVMNVDGTEPRQLTFDAANDDGTFITMNMSPVFGPADGTHLRRTGHKERIYFISTRARDQSDRADTLNSDIYAIDVDGSNLERMTFTPVPEVAPSFVASGEFAGTIIYTILRGATGGFRGSLFRFAIDHDARYHLQPEAHPHFGISQPMQVFYGHKELPDGRGALTLMDDGNVWRGGPLAVLDRQLAVELPAGSESMASVPGFRHALGVLTPDVPLAGQSAEGFWRDPSPLLDNSILAAHVAGPFDLTSRTATPAGSLMRIRLREDRDLQQPRIATTEMLLPSTYRVSQPVALFARPFEDEPHERAWSEGDEPALLVHSGSQVNEALMLNLPPVGTRLFRTDLKTMRFLATVAPLVARHVPADETRFGLTGATHVSLTGRTPMFIVGEAAILDDGSVAANVPARAPMRLSTLDERGLAFGMQHHHWSAPLSKERFPSGIAPLAYLARCAGCHGAPDGRAQSALQPPIDLITQASVTAAMFTDHDRRRPRAPAAVHDATRVTVDFRRDVTPILNEKCATSGCHIGANPKGGLSLSDTPTQHYTDAYENLLRPVDDARTHAFRYVDATSFLGRKSYLIEKIRGEELDAPQALTAPCPPPGSKPLSEHEKLVLGRWIELGASFIGTPETRP